MRWLAGCLLGLAAGAALAQSTSAPTLPGEDWRVWALRMDKAQRALNYDATLVIDSGNDDWELFEVSQRIGPAGPEQQWVAQNGAGRRQVRTAQGISVLSSEGDQRIGQGPQFRAGPLLAALDQSYEVAVDARDRVAGRRAVRLSLQPRHPDRYGLRVWIDVDTGLPLRSERRAYDQSPLERRMVTRLAVLGFAGSPVPGSTPSSIPSDWKLPAGFQLVGSALAVPGLAGAHHWVLSDGVAWVSVYRLNLPPGKVIETEGWRHGALGQVTLRNGEDWYYVLGDLPQATLRRVGEAAMPAD
ncbi:MAG: MucB/RseB C-terminal domain-containing protein [Xanthomonadales bacterium]|nr:hypothetical protein [Xanthomonadales bacterium]MCC6594827.1 MucB/RseB C-terminal domain-containing protein [Xanthomonadales bacterium]MCE7931544.1 hypothetical protein [Xanthomonadales bacterium PRO6]